MPNDTERRQKRSDRVSLGLVVFVASSLVACGPTNPKRCVDQNGWVVDDEPCVTGTRTAVYPGVYHWYYGGRGLRLGERVSGGSFTPRSGVSYHSSTTRGGFGRSAVAHSSSGHA